MSDKTGIEWTDATWNVVIGCDKVSPGCDRCYAVRTAHRMQANPNPKVSVPYAGTESDGDWTGRVNLLADRLDLPLKWRRPRRIFVNAQSDLFHDEVPTDFIAKVFAIMSLAPQHTFQVLTKRHARMRSVLSADYFRTEVRSHAAWWADYLSLTLPPPHWPLPNVHGLVSVENQYWAERRIPALLETPLAVRGISAEPLLGPIDLLNVAGRNALTGVGNRIAMTTHRSPRQTHIITPACLDWVIVGGESGPGARPMHPDWARHLRDQCELAGVPFMFKQWGEWGPAPWKIPREPEEFTLDYKARAEATCATHAFTGGLYQDDDEQWCENFMKLGHQPWSLERDDTAPPCAQGMHRWGKKHAGRELDGRTWDEYPATTAAVPA